MGLPNGLVLAKHRLEGLTEQAQETAKDLEGILGKLKGQVERYE